MKEVKITEKARQVIRRLFSRNSVTVLKTDPELTELYDNFAFDKLLEHTTEISEAERCVVQLVSTLGSKGNHQFQTMVNVCLNVGVKPREIREIVYQAFPYIGFSKMLDFILFLNDEFENNNIKLPLDDQGTTTEENRTEKGREVLEEAFGNKIIDEIKSKIPAGQEHIYEFIANYSFGGFYTRTGLTMQQRELNTFCLLSSMGGAQKLMELHARANKHVGNSKSKMVAAVTAMIPYIGFPRTLLALDAINSAFDE